MSTRRDPGCSKEGRKERAESRVCEAGCRGPRIGGDCGKGDRNWLREVGHIGQQRRVPRESSTNHRQ